MTKPIIHLKAVIIEDEKRNAEALLTLLTDFCEEISVISIEENVKNGYKAIMEHKPDVVFLDVELPGENGFSLFDYFEGTPDFSVIFTTAYSEYAITAFDVDAVDYLTKPIGIQRLKKAVKRVRDRKNLSLPNQEEKPPLQRNTKETDSPRLSIPTGNAIIYQRINNILYCRGDNNYTTFYFDNKTKVVVSKTLKTYEKELEGHNFFRCHKSYLININKVGKFLRAQRIVVMEDGSEISVSMRKKEEMAKKLTKNNVF